jgi:hypothetical protein
MARSLPFEWTQPQLPALRLLCRGIEANRQAGRYAEADFLRSLLLGLDEGMRVTQDAGGKVSLWHWPEPPFTEQFHYANYGEFIANGRER